jgi:hypothetical protein
MTNNTREPVDVIKDFTEGWLSAAEGLVEQITALTQLGSAIADQQVEDLCRWGDDGGYIP